MVKIYDDVSSIRELIDKHDQICLYGAGASCKLLLLAYWKDVLKGHVGCIIDADPGLSESFVRIADNGVYITSPGEDIEPTEESTQSDVDEIEIRSSTDVISESGDSQLVILLTPAFSATLIEYLDELVQFDGAKVYLLPMLCYSQKSKNFSLKSSNESLIPKIIHYFWIGGNEIPEEYKKNIEGWKRLNPDYEIRCWNEDNYDFNRIPYTREAYNSGRENLMFVTDYARMDVLYRYGGIYLDTDVELLKSLDELLYNNAFIGIEENAQLNSGSAIGAVAGHPMIRKLMDIYEDRHFFDENGNPRITYNTFFETKCFIENGYRMVNEYQTVCDMVCFPREVFLPICYAGLEDCFSEKTVSIHRINPEKQKLHRQKYEQWKNRVHA